MGPPCEQTDMTENITSAKFEHVQGIPCTVRSKLNMLGGLVWWDPPIIRQTDMTENITSATPLAGGDYRTSFIVLLHVLRIERWQKILKSQPPRTLLFKLITVLLEDK